MSANAKPIVIFGTGDFAELVHFYFTRDAARTVAAFTVDREYLKEECFCGVPVVAFEEVEKHYPPEEYEMFVAIGYGKSGGFAKILQARKDRFHQAKARGYRLPTYISSRAIVCSPELVGENCCIMEGNTVQPFVQIGNNVVMFAGNTVGHHAVLEDHVFLANHAVVGAKTKLEEGTFVGIGATLRNYLTVGRESVIGAGSVLLKDSTHYEVYKAEAAMPMPIKSDALKTL